MGRVSRREVLSKFAAAAAGAGAAIVGSHPVMAFSRPSPKLRYLKFAGTDFFPRSTVQPSGDRSERTYFDNGSIYSSGPNDLFVARVQLPDHSCDRGGPVQLFDHR